MVMPAPAKSYRRPRRPPAHLRTKTGCLTCRRRRKKCDERPETCENCDRRWLQCIWPSQCATGAPDALPSELPISKSSPKQTLSPSAEHIRFRTSPGTESPGPPYYPIGHNITPDAADSPLFIHPEEDESTDVELCQQEPSILTKVPATVPWFVEVIPSTSSSLFDLLQTKWLRQLIRPMASLSLIELYHHESMSMALQTPFYMHALLACCAAEYPVAADVHAQNHFCRLSAKHYVRAITGLREALAASGSGTHREAIVRTVLALCIFERAKPWPSSGVGTHLSGLAQLIQCEAAPGRGDFGGPGRASASSSALQRVMLEAFVFHAATSVPFQPLADQQSNLDVAMRFAQNTLEDMFPQGTETPAYPDSPVLGVQPKLFVLIREISLVHREHELDPSRPLQPRQGLDAMQEQLSQYRYLYSMGASMAPETETEQSNPARNPLSVGPMLYVLAAEILLADVLGEARDDPYISHGTIPKLVQQGVQLVSQLNPSTDYYAEYYGWPVYVLAKFVDREQDRDCLLRQVNAFWGATRSGTMLRLADMLGQGSIRGMITI